jgi:hypothetical protein
MNLIAKTGIPTIEGEPLSLLQLKVYLTSADISSNCYVSELADARCPIIDNHESDCSFCTGYIYNSNKVLKAISIKMLRDIG